MMFSAGTADRRWVELDYVIAILAPLNTGGDRPEFAAYLNILGKVLDGQPLPNPDQCAVILKKFNVNDPKINALLDDYRYYEKTGEQRRPIPD